MVLALSQQLAESQKHYAKPADEHISLGRALRGILTLVPLAIFALLMYWAVVSRARDEKTVIVIVVIAAIVGVLWGIFVSGVRIAAQWERGVVLRLGNFKAVRGPGLLYIIPIIEYVRFIDTRILVVNIPHQKVITRDNVPAEIDGALFSWLKTRKRR